VRKEEQPWRDYKLYRTARLNLWVANFFPNFGGSVDFSHSQVISGHPLSPRRKRYHAGNASTAAASG
jgi:hypothetical protein